LFKGWDGLWFISLWLYGGRKDKYGFKMRFWRKKIAFDGVELEELYKLEKDAYFEEAKRLIKIRGAEKARSDYGKK
jgi:hypothetical protein